VTTTASASWFNDATKVGIGADSWRRCAITLTAVEGARQDQLGACISRSVVAILAVAALFIGTTTAFAQSASKTNDHDLQCEIPMSSR